MTAHGQNRELRRDHRRRRLCRHVAGACLGRSGAKGFRVALVDAGPPEGSKADARASALSAASKGLLSVLGVWPELADGAQAIATIEITDSSLDARRRPHLLGFDDDLKPGEVRRLYDRE